MQRAAVHSRKWLVSDPSLPPLSAASELAARPIAQSRVGPNTYAANPEGTGDFMSAPEGRELLSFIVSCALPEDVEIRVWDSSAEVRYLVLPMRPEGTDGAPEESLAGLVTRDAMIGVARL